MSSAKDSAKFTVKKYIGGRGVLRVMPSLTFSSMDCGSGAVAERKGIDRWMVVVAGCGCDPITVIDGAYRAGNFCRVF